MSKEEAKRFLIELHTNNMAADMFEKRQVPDSEEEKTAIIAEVARATGYDVTAEEIAEAMALKRKEAEDKFEEVSKGLQAVGDGDLDEVAGGGSDNKFPDVCALNFSSSSWSEKCFFNDICNSVHYSYEWKDPCTGTELSYPMARCITNAKTTEWTKGRCKWQVNDPTASSC